MFVEDFILHGGLSKDQIDEMNEKALYLVENIGIDIPHKKVLDLLANYNGVKVNKNNVRFKNDLVMEALKKSKYILPEYTKNRSNWVISSGVNQTKYYDLNTNKIREPNTADLIELTKLCDVLDTVGAAPVPPLRPSR